MITEHKANRLINSTSPYLLQHAYNPVDWYEWSAEALERARQEDKPILLSIGYSSCHWCHVMEHESFEKMPVAELMNEFFVCIKVDREERPDIDQIYMDAVHALGIQGGWPLNVFLTPDQKPFFGGTYFSPDIWKQVLGNIHKAFHDHRDKIEHTAQELHRHLQRAETAAYTQTNEETPLKKDLLSMYQKLESNFDSEWGGVDKAPKFIMPSLWLWLLRYYHLSQNDNALAHINLTLKRIARGGIYDQIGGGFSRYSVDRFWFAPHFEKMLYDNAQLLSLYSEAFSITKDEEYKNIVYETFDWLQREMTSDEGGFYSALDADSEGTEGKFYVWTQKEIEKKLGANANLLVEYYNVDDKGNWEHGANILNRAKSDEAFRTEQSLTKSQWEEVLKTSKKTLLRERNERIRPGLDNKIITAWNALTISGLTDCYKAFDDKRFLKAAMLNMRFLENELMESTKLYRSYKDKPSNIPAFLDDYAALIQAQIKLYEVTFDEYWIKRAEAFTIHAIDHFYDSQDGYFFYTSNDSEKLLTRKKELFDNVIPSSNSIMAWNLYRIGSILDKNEWKTVAAQMINRLSKLISEEPNYMSNWAIVMMEIRAGLAEIALLGEEAETLRQEFHIEYHPFSILMGTRSSSTLPLLSDKTQVKKKTTAYVCYNKTCYSPVHTIEGVTKQLSKLRSQS
jgi:uncharacterized protein